MTRNHIACTVVSFGLALAAGHASAQGQKPSKTGCDDLADAASCVDRAVSNAGNTHGWKVSKAGAYVVTVAPTGKNAALRLWPHLTVTDAAGKQLAQDGSDTGEPASVTVCVDKGVHRLAVRDVDAKHIEKLKGGAGYTVSIQPADAAACLASCDALAGTGACSARVTKDDGNKHTWKVTKAGAYTVTLAATGSNAALKLWPLVSVVDSSGKELAKDGSDSGEAARVTVCVTKGSYTLHVRDVDEKHISKLEGGAGYTLQIAAGDQAKCSKK